MMDVETQVAHHYTHGGCSSVLQALRNAGKDVDHCIAAISRLGVNSIWVGPPPLSTLPRTRALPTNRVLDRLGAGWAGPPFAETFGAHVTGIDLTLEYVDVADELTKRCGLADRAVFPRPRSFSPSPEFPSTAPA